MGRDRGRTRVPGDRRPGRARARREAAFAFVEGSDVYALGACPDIRYQQPFGQAEPAEDARDRRERRQGGDPAAPGDRRRPVPAARRSRRYAAVRAHFLDPALPLYSVYVFDDGSTCTQLPHRFFASVNGDMIWSGLELVEAHRRQRLPRPGARDGEGGAPRTSRDPAGVFADLQAENDIVEPLVEAMYALATEAGAGFARAWILENAAAALSAETRRTAPSAASSTGPPPRATVTAWQTNGGLALEIAAAALDPGGAVPAGDRLGRRPPGRHARSARPARSTSPAPASRSSGRSARPAASPATRACSSTGARRSTAPASGRTSRASAGGCPGTVLFAWRWPGAGRHTISFAPGLPNGKEGPSFLHVRAYLVLP